MADPFSLALAGGTSLFNAFSQSSENRKNRQFQQAENQKSREYNTEMWNKNNEYNTITNQMQRFKDAGVNPHLAYQNGSPMNTSNAPASSNASSMPAGIAPRIESGQIMQAMLMKSQIANIEADTKEKESRANNIDQNTENQFTVNELTKLDLQNYNATWTSEQNLRTISYEAQKIGINLTEENIKKTTQEITNLVTSNSKINQEIKNLQEQFKLTSSEVSAMLQLAALRKAQTISTYSDTELTREQIKNQSFIRSNVQAETNQKTELARGYAMQNRITQDYGADNAKLNNIYQKYQTRMAGQNVYKGEIDVDFYKINKALNTAENAGGAFGSWVEAFTPWQSGTTETTTNTENYDRRGNHTGSTTSSTYQTRRGKR